jgi:hypothetical protein
VLAAAPIDALATLLEATVGDASPSRAGCLTLLGRLVDASAAARDEISAIGLPSLISDMQASGVLSAADTAAAATLLRRLQAREPGAGRRHKH